MSIVSWNCRGLGNLATVQVLSDLVREKKPSVIFPMETKAQFGRRKMLREKLGFEHSFVVESVGLSGGLCLLWRDYVTLHVYANSLHYIDCLLCIEEGELEWRFTGFYGCPERNRRRESWSMLRSLSHQFDNPWLVAGDFNDTMFDSERRGQLPQPNWLMQGFRDAIRGSGLRNLQFEGYQWT
ncbi:unnamed protein product [Cuscuta epithymum]|uniref:Endonuclease/exonuclease/phosphatase domain-containing protein n=1 Tax=Cuscuta epithymum TaxID=186058 RepID=A0AAV0E306_9ASTE|nr:unnamed protein product [Cuscuta epithymum]